MCLCSKINKIYSDKGLYHGRPVQYTNVKQAASPVIYKGTPNVVQKISKK